VTDFGYVFSINSLSDKPRLLVCNIVSLVIGTMTLVENFRLQSNVDFTKLQTLFEPPLFIVGVDF